MILIEGRMTENYKGFKGTRPVRRPILTPPKEYRLPQEFLRQAMNQADPGRI